MKLSDLIQKIKRHKHLYFIYWKISDKDYLRNYLDYLFSTSIKEKKRIHNDLKMIKEHWKCDPMHYFRYQLYKKDLSAEKLLDYIPPYYFYNYYMPHIYRNLDLLQIDNKILANKLFIERGIPTATAVAFVQDKCILDSNNKQILIGDLLNILKSSSAEKFFIKPADGKGGQGIFVLAKNNDKLLIKGIPVSEAQLLRILRGNNYIIQEEIIQRPDLNGLNRTSVNTLRVITQYTDNRALLRAAVLRMGRNYSYVDNSAQGGVSVEIDLETGKLNRFAHTEHNMQVFESHPDTKIVFDSFTIAGWLEIKNEIKDWVGKLKEYNELAWDIAIGINKVYVIEVNSNYGLNHLQICIGGMRNRLNFEIEKII